MQIYLDVSPSEFHRTNVRHKHTVYTIELHPAINEENPQDYQLIF